MKGYKSLALGCMVALAFTAGIADPSVAAPISPEVVQKELMEERVSPRAEKWMKENPELASHLIDPSISTAGVITHSDVESDSLKEGFEAGVKRKVRCKSVTRYRDWRGTKILGIGGNVMYRYNTYVRWCYDGKKVTTVTDRYSYFSNVNYLYNVKKNDAINKVRIYGSNRMVHSQGAIEFAGIGKIPAFYYRPWNKVTVTGSGNSRLSSGE